MWRQKTTFKKFANRFLLATPFASSMNILSELSVLRTLSKLGLTALRRESTQRSLSSAVRQLKYRVPVGEVTCVGLDEVKNSTRVGHL